MIKKTIGIILVIIFLLSDFSSISAEKISACEEKYDLEVKLLAKNRLGNYICLADAEVIILGTTYDGKQCHQQKLTLKKRFPADIMLFHAFYNATLTKDYLDDDFIFKIIANHENFKTVESELFNSSTIINRIRNYDYFQITIEKNSLVKPKNMVFLSLFEQIFDKIPNLFKSIFWRS